MTDKTTTPGPADHGPDRKPPGVKLTQDGFTNARDQLLWEIRGEIGEAAGILLQRLDEVGMFNGGIDNTAWRYERPPADVLADTEAIIAEVREYAQEAEDALANVVIGHDWLRSGRPLRCYGCGQDIDPEQQMWMVDTSTAEGGLPVHDDCFTRGPVARARDLAATVAEDHYAAICEDRTRAGRPHPGDVVELDLIDTDQPDGPGTRPVQGVWAVSGDRAHTWVEVTASPTGTPAVGDLVDPLDAAGLRVVWLGDPPATTPADGDPVADDVAHHGAVCPPCARPLVPGLPAVWLAGHPTHRACALTAASTTPS